MLLSVLDTVEWSDKIPKTLESVVTDFPSNGSRVVFKLYWDVAPLACENFATLCTNGGNSLDLSGTNKKPKPAPIGESGKALTYRDSTIHRIVQGFILQGGDFVFGNGSGGESIYNGKKFKDERAGLALKHERAGILSMGNSGKNSNTSQFFVTLDKAPQCDGKHVVFGEVVSGMEVIKTVEQYTTTAAGSGEPSVPVKISDCGAYTQLHTPGAGFWYDRPDSESYTGITPEFMIRPRVAIIAPNQQVAEKFEKSLGGHASTRLFAIYDVEGGDDAIVQSLEELLERFALDVIVAAPACSKLLDSMDIPSSWSDAAKILGGDLHLPRKEEVVIVAKPVEIASAILIKSWVGRRKGWLLSASFGMKV